MLAVVVLVVLVVLLLVKMKAVGITGSRRYLEEVHCMSLHFPSVIRDGAAGTRDSRQDISRTLDGKCYYYEGNSGYLAQTCTCLKIDALSISCTTNARRTGSTHSSGGDGTRRVWWVRIKTERALCELET